jgi:stage II sporulation protein D
VCDDAPDASGGIAGSDRNACARDHSGSLAEVSPVADRPDVVARIFEIQAVIARTYAVSQIGKHRVEGFDVCDTTHCQLYEPSRITTSRFTPAARRAIANTRGQMLVFSRRPTQALFHADCGGHTAAAEVVWGGRPVPYLPGGRDDIDGAPHRAWTFSATLDRLQSALSRHPDTATGKRLDGLRVTERDASGRAATVELRGDTTRLVRGEVLRAVINQVFGSRAILSTRFEVTATAGALSFEGTGFGHGVGLCQVGAAARARRGDSLGAILQAYFPGATLAPALPRG